MKAVKKQLVIGTRGSKLAVWQAEHIKALLIANFPHTDIVLKHIITIGDKILDVPLAKISSKGLFTKKIEKALLAEELDLAVHNLKGYADSSAGQTVSGRKNRTGKPG